MIKGKGEDSMKKWTKIIIIFLLVTNSVFIFTTLNSKINNSVFKVYSFEGASDDIEISNGVIIISKDKQIVNGGEIQYLGEKKENIKSYTKTICEYNQGNKQGIVATHVSEVGATKGMTFPDELLLNKSLGEISAEKLFSEEGIGGIKDNLYFSLEGSTNEGKLFNFEVKLQVKELL